MTLIDADRSTFESKLSDCPAYRTSTFQHSGVNDGESRTVVRVWEGPVSQGRHLFQAATAQERLMRAGGSQDPRRG